MMELLKLFFIEMNLKGILFKGLKIFSLIKSLQGLLPIKIDFKKRMCIKFLYVYI